MNQLMTQPASLFPPDFDYRPSGERAGRELDAIRAEALTSAAPARGEADRLAAAREKAIAEHLAAVAEVDRLAAALEEAIVATGAIARAEKALAEQPGKVSRLAHRVTVLKDAADRAADAADTAEETTFNKLCWSRLPAARDAVEAAAEALREYDRRAEAGRKEFLAALADAQALAGRLKGVVVVSQSIENGQVVDRLAKGIDATAGVTP